MMKDMDNYDQYLLDNGFVKFDDPSGVTSCLFQKIYRDEKGKKYFIDVRKFEFWKIAYEYSTQLYAVNTAKAIDLVFHSDWNLKEVEQYLEALFDTELFGYYELWDGE